MTTKNLQYESGRSMVEMLGVLAVIGVLSIGGIAGYSYGMDKYRANETINDVNLRALDITNQLMMGSEPNLNAWAEISTAGYPISLNTDDAPTNYYIKVEKVPLEVCNIIAETMPETVIIKVDNVDYACAEGENIMEFSYPDFITETDASKKCGSFICLDCQKCDTETQTCVNLEDYEDKCTTADNQTGWCVGGSCTPDVCNCGENQYCVDTNESMKTPHPTLECENLNFIEKTITYTDETGDKKTETWYLSNTTMTWWDAKSSCTALGKKLASTPSDFLKTEWLTNFYSELTNRATALNNAFGSFNFWSNNLKENLFPYFVSLDKKSILVYSGYTADVCERNKSTCFTTLVGFSYDHDIRALCH